MLRAVFILLNQKYYVSTIALRTRQQNPQGAHRSAGNTGGQATDKSVDALVGEGAQRKCPSSHSCHLEHRMAPS